MRQSIFLRLLAVLALTGSLSVATVTAIAAPPSNDFHQWAATPPMGWNSWDGFGTTVTEAQTKQQTDYMADKLKAHGWQYIIVDIQWYEPNAKGFTLREGAALAMDDFGRLLPAPNKFPSAAGGQGFKPLADYVHGKGLKFGIHMMRGIPRQAVKQNTPILGTTCSAADIADTNSICPWNPDMYGVDMTKPGAQAYYDSLLRQLSRLGRGLRQGGRPQPPLPPAPRSRPSARPSTRPAGPWCSAPRPARRPLSAGAHVDEHANMWRISDDFWDDWARPLRAVQAPARLDALSRHRRLAGRRHAAAGRRRVRSGVP